MVCQSVHILLVSIIGCMFLSCHSFQTFVLDGKVMDGGSGNVYLYRYGNKNFVLIDSLSFTNGTFEYKGEVDQPLLYGVSVRNNDQEPQSFFVGGDDTLHLSFWKTGKEVLVQGSALNDAYLSMREKAKGASEQAIFRYVHDYKDSPVTAYFVLHDWSWRLSLDALKLIYRTLVPSLKDCLYLQKLYSLIGCMEKIEPGKPFPIIKGVVDNRLKQPAILVFFATWCPDCQMEIPALEDVAEKGRYAIFGVSLDTERQALTQFRKEHPSIFQKVAFAPEEWDSPIVQAYAVRWIPTFFLLSTEGKIVRSAHSITELFDGKK